MFTFHHQLGGACDFLAGVLGDAGVLAGVRQLHVDDVQLAVFAVSGELVLGTLAQVGAVLHPGGDGGGGRHLALEHGGGSDGLGLQQQDVLDLLHELQRHRLQLEPSEGILRGGRAFSSGLQAAASAGVTGRRGLSRCKATDTMLLTHIRLHTEGRFEDTEPTVGKTSISGSNIKQG